jgi:ligand-binding sensor domain-containing protein/signal transduction histidine kinase/DNA-binding response OmpR family regulator
MKPAGIFVYLILCFFGNTFGQDIRFRKITSNQGLSHNTVYAITQDKNGFMWFATREGLNRYDSYSLKNYYVKDSKPGGSANKISSLSCIGELIYVGTDNGLYTYNSKTDQLQEVQDFPQKHTVLFLHQQDETVYVGTTTGLYKISKNKIKLISETHISARAMCTISPGKFLFATGNAIKIINGDGEVLKTFEPSSLSKLAEATSIFSMYKDPYGEVWLATNLGLFNYHIAIQSFSRLNFSTTTTPENNTVRSVSGDKKDLLYIGTEEGLYIYNLKTGHSENIQQSFTNDPKKLNDKAVYSTYVAKDGSIWLGTYFGGVNYIPSNTYGFKSIMANDKEKGLMGKAVSQMMEDSQHNIWIGTEDGGITIYNSINDTYTAINKKSSPFYLTTNNVHAIHNDGYGNIWVGTFLGGLHQFDTKRKTTTVYSKEKENPNSLSNDQVYAIYRDSRGKLWVATQSGLNLFNYQTKKFSLFMPEIMGDMFIYDIIEDKNSEIWFCTRQNGIFNYNPITNKLKQYNADGNRPVLLSNQIISVYKDSKQQLWFGTLDGGVSLYNPDQKNLKNYTITDGLPNNNVYGILEDDRGFIWLTTNRGLSRLDPKTKKFVNYDNKYGLPSNQFNFKSYLKSSKGILYFGSINGLCFFDPSIIATDHSLLPLMFTDFQLFNKSVVPGKSDLLQNQINYTEKLELAYDQNVFTINYAAINYANPGSTNYAYYLEGFQNKWNYVGDKNSVTYTNLSPGNYTFHIKAVNATRIASSLERTLQIHVAPPFYLSNLAYFIYILSVVVLIWLYTRFVKFLHLKKLEIQLERVEKEKIKELTQHRLNFFTFISHEFKTPLTLILASIDKFLEDKGTEFKKSTELSNVKSNASILFKLIQQLMEFRKIETDHASINLSKSNLVNFIRNATSYFETMTIKKDVVLNFTSSVPLLECYFDKDKMEKIIFNILSNAVKNTSKGSISVILGFKDQDDDKKLVTLLVKDTGKGMSAIELINIFNPFYKSTIKGETLEGSGIGMALVDSLVKYLNGNINIKSTPQEGTSVEINLPVLIQLTGSKEDKLTPKIVEETTLIKETIAPSIAKTTINVKTKYSLLIVEDNKELLTFLSQHFSKTYEVATATNGVLAMKKINKTAPDIIISDVKMPKMDGLELCNQLKNDNRFNYIPFILLSDSNTENIKMDGLDIGADAYISKPFNLKEFELLISNMIKSRVKLREHVISIGSFIADKLPNNNKDQEFLSKLSKVLEKEFSNPKITIEDIAKELNTSRTMLHNNLKRILDKNATELLNDYRLKKAIIMLENDMPVGEIAYYCGYSDPNYFSRIFKKVYQETPINYKRKFLVVK